MKQKLGSAAAIAVLLIGVAVGLNTVDGSGISSDDERREALRSLLLDQDELAATMSDDWRVQAVTRLGVESGSELTAEFTDLVTAAVLFRHPASGTMLNALLEAEDGETAKTLFQDVLPDPLISIDYEVASLSDSLVDQLLEAGLPNESDVRLYDLENGERIIALLVSEGCASLQENCILWTGGPLEVEQLVAVAEAQLNILLEGRSEQD